MTEVVADRIAKPLGVVGDLYIGHVPHSEWPRIARLERTREVGRRPSFCCWKRLVSKLESAALVLVGNSTLWKEICLPSSNGFMTARAVARMYGALANRGVLADGSRLVRADTVDALTALAFNSSGAWPPVPRRGSDVANSYLSCGFSPWPDEDMHGHRHILGHDGMGGCFAYADMQRQLGVAVLKNSYSHGFSESSLRVDVCRAVQSFADADHHTPKSACWPCRSGGRRKT